MSGLEPGPASVTPLGPAFYSQPTFLRRQALRDWWTLLHPPYTSWHLAYVVIGASLVAPLDVGRLLATLLAFFLAVGVGAHALDELQGRPLRTQIPSWVLVTAAVLGLGGAVALGVLGAIRVSPYLAMFIVVGVALALGYNLELAGGRLHNDWVFAAAWGAFPLLTASFAQHGRLSVAACVAAGFAYFLSRAQRDLSTPSRALRRSTVAVHGSLTSADGTRSNLTAASLLTPLERALRSLSWAVVLLAAALAIAQTHP